MAGSLSRIPPYEYRAERYDPFPGILRLMACYGNFQGNQDHPGIPEPAGSFPEPGTSPEYIPPGLENMSDTHCIPFLRHFFGIREYVRSLRIIKIATSPPAPSSAPAGNGAAVGLTGAIP